MDFVVCLDLLGAPAGVGLAHVGRGLNGGDELEDGVADANEADEGAGNDAEDAAAEENGSHEDVEDTTADEGEEERGVSRDLRRDLELEEADGGTKDDDVDTNDEGLESIGLGEELRDTTKDHNHTNRQVDDAKDVGQLHDYERISALMLK